MGRNSFQIGEPTYWLLLSSLGIPSLLYVLHFPTKLPSANYQLFFLFFCVLCGDEYCLTIRGSFNSWFHKKNNNKKLYSAYYLVSTFHILAHFNFSYISPFNLTTVL